MTHRDILEALLRGEALTRPGWIDDEHIRLSGNTLVDELENEVCLIDCLDEEWRIMR